MVNTKTMGHVFKHPDYYKKLKASNKLVSASTDQLEPEAPSDKQQAIDETVPHCDIEEAASSEGSSEDLRSSKPQAPSLDKNEAQASSPKQQGSSFKP